MRYIGNKTRLLKNIKEFIEENKIKGKIFCDIFAGTSSVGDNFKSEYKIISNDLLTSSYCIAKAKLLNNKIPDFKKFIKKFNVSPFDYLNNKKYEYQSNFFVTNQYSPKGNRMFFTEENAIIIDGMRLEIEEHYKEALFSENEYYFLIGSLLESVTKFSNTSGTYEAFLKKWDSRALKKFEIKPLEMATCETLYDLNEVYNEDANQLIRKIEGEILYIDPPYTITDTLLLIMF
jgi:adenine-specific DNA-methyltransferase